ncbi:MAG: S46 family peptidase [Planctomycetota bacterium]
MIRQVFNTQILRRFAIIVASIAAICIATLASNSRADEGMWLFNDLPLKHLKEKHGFEPSAEWSEHLMKSCVRFNVGGSASFISSNGLVLTNHHVGSDTLHKLSSEENDYYTDGFLANSLEEELKAPDLELNQLINIQDVTAQVNAAVSSKMSAADAAKARRVVIGEIEKKATDESGLRSDVVTLYGGGRYHLYQYKKYTDVRLVWSPEANAAFFGGDADNFEYPRFCLDACIFRVYEDGKPAKIEHFLKWSSDGPKENELVFVAGNPGRTSRINTVAALRYQRDVRMPYVLDFIRRREVLLQQFSLGGKESARRAHDGLFGIQNSRKAYMGMLQGLQDPRVMASKVAAEEKLLAAVKADPKMADYASAWDTIAEIQKKRAATLGKGVRLTTTLFTIAQQLVQMAEEDTKPSAERLPTFRESARASLQQQLFSTAPIYKDLEQALMADRIALMLESRGGDDVLCQKILNGMSAQDRAADLVKNTKLHDPEYRKALAAKGQAGIEGCEDPMILLAKMVDPIVRKEQQEADELAEMERQAYAKIAEAKFATEGTSAYPDATFSLRLAFGPVVGYEENGETISAMTNFAGAFTHEERHAGQEYFDLPKSWHDAKSNGKLKMNTPYNFVCTADIIGGNSGSPVVNKDLELVGLIFDGNIQSLPADYLYSDRQARSVSVHSNAIREAIRYVYGAESLSDQLGK